MDLNGYRSHLQRCLIEESDELSREENNHLLSQELCRAKDREIDGEKTQKTNEKKSEKQAARGNITVTVSTAKLRD